MKKGNVILLNGVSSAGKTSLSKALQSYLKEPYYHICCDDFMHMTPRQILHDDFDNQLLITQGIMHQVVRMFSDQGHHVIVDDVVLNLPDKNDWLYEYAVLLDESPVLLVGVSCPLAELERREVQRGDRNIGQTRWQLEHAYPESIYDLVVNTYENTTEICVKQILVMLQKPNDWLALKNIKRLIEEQRGNI